MPPELQRYRYDPGWIAEVKIGILSGFAVIGVAVLGTLAHPLVMEWLIVFIPLAMVGGGVAWFLLRHHDELTHEIEVTSHGLGKVKGGRERERLLWIDVRRARYRRLWSRLEIHGRTSRFFVGDRLENWAGLLETIRLRTGREIEKTWF